MAILHYLLKNPLIIFAGAVSLFVSIVYLLTYFDERRHMDSPEPGEEPKVSVLIPAYNEAGIIGENVRDIIDLGYENKEIIVVDNGSEDGTYQRVEDFRDRENFSLVYEEEGGKANAVNTGLEYCQGDLVFVLDADSVPEEGVIRKMAGFFENDDDVMAVVPTLRSRTNKSLVEKIQSIEYVVTAFMRKILSFISSLNVTPGASMYRKEFFEEHGDFDESTLTEDLEMGMRIQDAGYKVEHALDATVQTKVPESVSGLKRQRLRWGFGKFEVLNKYTHMFSLEKGELGFFYLPAVLATTLLPVAVLGYLGYQLFNSIFTGAYHQYLIGFDFSYIFSNLFSGSFNVNMAHIVLGVLMITGFSIYLLARRNIKDVDLKPTLAVYLVGYGMVLSFFQMLVVARYVTGRKPGW